MKKFITKLLIYIFILLGFVLVINLAYIKLDRSDDDGTKKFQNIPTDITICNFGSSHGQFGYNYEDIDNDYTCFNFALVSQTLSYDCRLLKNYQDSISEEAVVFITVSYFSFFGINEAETENFEVKNKRYYKILPASLVKDYNLCTGISEMFPSVYADREKLAVVLLGGNQGDSDESWERTAEDIDVVRDANAAYLRHLVANKQDEKGRLIYNEEEISALYEMIAICREKGATPILVTTPFLSEYTDRVQEGTPEFLGEFYGLLNQVIADTNVEYYDYSMDERFQNEYSLFMNSDHLNKEGARIFTNLLIDDVLE